MRNSNHVFMDSSLFCLHNIEFLGIWKINTSVDGRFFDWNPSMS